MRRLVGYHTKDVPNSSGKKSPKKQDLDPEESSEIDSSAQPQARTGATITKDEDMHETQSHVSNFKSDLTGTPIGDKVENVNQIPT